MSTELPFQLLFEFGENSEMLLIEAGAELPTNYVMYVTTKEGRQDRIEVILTGGFNESVRHKYLVRDVPPDVAGGVVVQLTIHVDTSGAIGIKAMDNGTKQPLAVDSLPNAS